MNADKKRKLRNIALLVLIGLIGGTFAFQAFNQQIINDRLREHPAPVGARVHDYFNRETENKDVFVENFGQEPIMARIRLSEFMEYQERGEAGWTQVLEGNRHDSRTWTIYKPEADNINNRRDDSAAFTPFSTLTFGWERDNQDEPWYLPTFNHDSTDLTTAAAGDAQDYLERGATHPGNGRDNFWQANVSYTNGSNGIPWPGSTEGTRTTKQNLHQERNPITLQEWSDMVCQEPTGDFWVLDEETGWAYWANTIAPGQATSYLIDEARMEAAAHDINGSYYYGIHVDSQLISPDEKFYEEPVDGNLGQLLQSIRAGVNNEGISVSDLDFSSMAPGDIFTRDEQEFRYLENMGGGNHLIIRNVAFRGNSFDGPDRNNQVSFLQTWFATGIPNDLRAMVQPVACVFPVGMISIVDAGLDGDRWLVDNLVSNPIVAADETKVVPREEGGIRRAFALSLADVDRLSRTADIGFSSRENRSDGEIGDWWIRTPSSLMLAWFVNERGELGQNLRDSNLNNGGVRPALIIRQ